MSDEYIKRKDVLAELDYAMGFPCGSPIKAYMTAYSIVEDIPPADVAERKRGKWLSDKRQHFCSECRKKAKSIVVDIKLVDNYYCHKSEPITEYKFGEFLSDFCYFCGADMRGNDNED